MNAILLERTDTDSLVRQLEWLDRTIPMLRHPRSRWEMFSEGQRIRHEVNRRAARQEER